MFHRSPAPATGRAPARTSMPALAAPIIENPRRRAWLAAAAIALILGVHVAGRVGGYCSPLNSDDSYIFASFGCRMARGDVLYRDMSDIKPPGLFMLYALTYLAAPAERFSIIPVESLFLLAGYYAIFRVGAAVFGRRAGWVLAVLSALAVNYFTVTGFAIVGFGVAENFMVFPAAAAAYFYVRANRRRRGWDLFWVGVFMGVSTCIKQTALPVVAAVALHWTITELAVDRRPRRWASGWLWMLAGGCAAWAPAIGMLTWQGTLPAAFHLLTDDAGKMLTRGSAWPADWRSVVPLAVPLAWAVWSLGLCVERRVRGVALGPADGRPSIAVPSVDWRSTAFLVTWCAAEALMVAHLPLRSSHYYVSSCVPFVLLSGWTVAMFDGGLTRWSPVTTRSSLRRAAWSVAVVGSAAFSRPVVDEIVPRAITACRGYDWAAEHRRFAEALNWGPIHFGRGAPFVTDRPGSDREAEP